MRRISHGAKLRLLPFGIIIRDRFDRAVNAPRRLPRCRHCPPSRAQTDDLLPTPRVQMNVYYMHSPVCSGIHPVRANHPHRRSTPKTGVRLFTTWTKILQPPTRTGFLRPFRRIYIFALIV